MTFYELLLFVHVLAVITWMGGAIMFEVIAERVVASNDPARVGAFLSDAKALGQKYFAPASATTLISGLWLVFEGGWGFDQPFVLGGLAGLVLSMSIGFGVLQPTGKKVGQALGATGSITAEVSAGLTRLRNFSRMSLLILVIALFLMTVKPGS